MVDKLTSSVKPLTVVSTINDIIDNLGGSYSATNPTLTPVNGICTWVVTHNLGTKNVICTLYSGNLEISKSVNLDSDNALTITFNALDIVAAGTCTVVIVAQGGTASGGGGSEYSLPTASTTTLGGVKIDGTSITIDANGVISGSSSYALPTASTTTLGGVKIDGTSITINDGVISANQDKVPNVLCTNSLTSTNNVLSNFSKNNFALLPVPFNPNGQSWEIGVCFKLSDISVPNCIFSGTANFSVSLFADGNNKKLYFNVGNADRSGWLVSSQYGTTVLSANTKYWAKLEFTGSAYNMYLSTDGVTYNLEKSVTSSVYCKVSTPLVFWRYPNAVYNVNYEIYLKDCYVKVNDIYIWQGLSITSPQNNLLNEYFIPTETYVIPYYTNCAGFITGSNTWLDMAIPLPKKLDLIKSVTVPSLKVQARGTGGYAINNQDLAVLGSIQKTILSGNTLCLEWLLSTAISSSTAANSPLNVLVYADIPITFNG